MVVKFANLIEFIVVAFFAVLVGYGVVYVYNSNDVASESVSGNGIRLAPLKNDGLQRLRVYSKKVMQRENYEVSNEKLDTQFYNAASRNDENLSAEKTSQVEAKIVLSTLKFKN